MRNRHKDDKKTGAWNRKFPIGELRKLKLLPTSDGDSNDLEALLSFLKSRHSTVSTESEKYLR